MSSTVVLPAQRGVEGLAEEQKCDLTARTTGPFCRQINSAVPLTISELGFELKE
jgi:hypothetical protein